MKHTWKCWDCGNEGHNFSQITYQNRDYGDEYDVECDQCHSVNTGLEDEGGTPECDCGTRDWYCALCRHYKCTDCWNWIPSVNESDDYICENCVNETDH